MSNIYCGIGDVPKGQRRGTMEECAKIGQVRYYGIKQINPRVLEASKKNKNDDKDKVNLLEKKITLHVQIKKLIAKMKETTDDNLKNEYCEEAKKKNAEMKLVIKSLNKNEISTD